MANGRYIFKNITLLNTLLASIIILMSQYSVLPLLNMHTKYVLPSQKKAVKEEKGTPVQSNTPSPSDYNVIAEENLFHPERKIPPENKDEPPPLPKPDVLLYGTLITDNTSVAYVEDLKSLRNTPGRGRRQTALKKGDSLSGFTIKEISVDSIVMVRGDETMTVSVLDPQKRKARGVLTTPSRTPPGQPSQVTLQLRQNHNKALRRQNRSSKKSLPQRTGLR